MLGLGLVLQLCDLALVISSCVRVRSAAIGESEILLDKYYEVNKKLTLNGSTWTWFGVVRILESHIGNDRQYEFWVGYWVGL